MPFLEKENALIFYAAATWKKMQYKNGPFSLTLEFISLS